MGQQRRFERVEKRIISFLMSAMLIFSSILNLIYPVSAYAATTAEFNSESIGSDWTCLGTNYIGGEIAMSGTGMLAVTEISLSGISDSVDVGTLDIDFSLDVDFVGENPSSAVNAASATIRFLDASNALIGSPLVLSSGTTIAPSTISLSSGASIPTGARAIEITLEANDSEGIFTEIIFKNISLYIRDTANPGISADYNTAWTNTPPLTITINATDTESGVSAIYDADSGSMLTDETTYTYDVTENGTRQFFAADYSGRSSDMLVVEVTNIDTNAPIASPEITLSEAGWTSNDVTVTLGEITPASGESPETRQYQIGAGGWQDYSDVLTFDTDTNVTVYSRTVDEAGNVSAVENSAQVQVDKTSPDVALSMTPGVSGGATIETAISDAGSGIQEKKYAAGVQDTAYFAGSGTTFTGTDISVATGGDYTVYAIDVAGNATVETVSVNTYPTIGAIEDQTVDEDVSRTITFSVGDSETAASGLNISAVANGAVASITSYSIDGATGIASLTFISNLNQFGSDSITVTISDGPAPDGLSVTKTFNVLFQPVDDSPIAQDDTPAAVDEDSGYNEIDVLANDSDAEGTVTIDTYDTVSAQGGAVRINGTGDALEYRSVADFAGSDSFTYTVLDETGNPSNTATVYITVTNSNDAPIAYNEVQFIDEDEDTEIVIDVLFNDIDADIDVAGDSLTITSVTPIDAAAGSISTDGSQVLYTPTQNYYGTFSFDYTIEDDAGETATATVTVVVEKVNDDPEFSGLSGAYSFDEDTPSYTIDFSVSDVETAPEDLMVQVSTSNTAVIRQSELAFQDHQDSDPQLSLIISPRENINGVCTLTIQLSDGNVIVSQEVTITINAINDEPVAVADTFAYIEDQPLIIDMDEAISNDTDTDGDTLSLDSVDTGSISTGSLQLVDAGENTYRFTPPSDYNGNATFTYTVSDGQGGEATGTVTLTGKSANDAPVIVPEGSNVYETDEDVLSADIVFSISDLETATDDLLVTFGSSNEDLIGKEGLNYTKVGGVVTLNVMPNSNAPAAVASATSTITMTVSDRKASTEYDFVFTVYAVEDAPIAVDDQANVVFNGIEVISPLDNDYDNDLDTISIMSYTYTGTGTVTRSGDELTYTAPIGFTGTDTIEYTIEDPNGNTDSGTITLYVGISSVPPEIEQIQNTKTNEDTPVLNIPFSITDNDTDDIDLTVSSDSSNTDLIDASGITLVRVGGGDYTISLSPKENQFGTSTITVTADDGDNSTSITFDFTVYSINDLPVAVTDEVTTNEDVSVSFDPIANDTDVETETANLSLAGFTEPSHGRIAVAGSLLTYIPDDNYYGADTITYELTDGEATVTGTVDFTINFVNDNPVGWNNWKTAPAYVPGNSPVEIDVITNDRDVDVYEGVIHRDNLYVLSYTQGAHGTVALLPNGNLTYTRTEAGEGTRETDSFTYIVSDPLGGTNSATVYIATEFGDSLYSNSVSPTRTEDMGPYTISLSIHIPSDVTNYSIVTAGVDKGTITAIDETNFTLTYEPTPNANGSDTFTYTVINDDDPTETATSNVYLFITPVNDAPYFTTTQPDVTVSEDSTSETYTVSFTDVDDDITDEELEFWFYFADSGNAEDRILVQEGITMNRTGGTVTFSLTSLENAFGSLPIAMKLSDNTETVSQNFTYTVTPTNDMPTAPDVYKTVEEDAFVTMTVVNSNSDIEDGDNVTVTTGAASKGSVVVNPDKTITYSPALNETGSDSFTYTLIDTVGGDTTGTVYITITPVNDAPNIYNYQHLNQSLEDTPLDVTFSLSDVDNTFPEVTVTVESSDDSILDDAKISIPASAASMTLTLTPEENANGTVFLTITATDGDQSISREIEVRFEPVNDYPVATNNGDTTNEDTYIDLNLAGDDTDIDDTELSVIAMTDPANGRVTILSNGLVRYTPDENFYGFDAFVYTVSDPLGGTDTANVTIQVLSVNDAPVAEQDEADTDEDNAVSIDVLANDSDVEGDTLSIDPLGFSGGAKADSLTVVGGEVLYTPIANVYGDDTFTYTVMDGNGGSTTAVVTVHIQSELDAPEATYPAGEEPPWTMYEDQTVTFIVDYTSVEPEYPEVMMTATSSNTAILPNTNIEIAKDPTVGMTTRMYITCTPVANSYSEAGINIQTTQKVGSATFNKDIKLYILPRNDQPTISVTDIAIDEDTTGYGTATGSDVETATASLTYRLSETVSEQPTLGTATVNADGSYSYTPNSNANGTDTFYVVVDDGFTGGGAMDDPATNKALVTVTIAPQNDGPSAVADTATVDEDQSVNIDVLANDQDVDISREGDSLSIDSYTQPSHGTVAASGDLLVYTPDAHYNGEDTFEYTMIDEGGLTDSATVTVTINPIPDDPVDGADSYTVVEDSQNNTFDVLVNDDPDFDTDGEELTLIKVLETDQPEHGMAAVNITTNEILYSPFGDYYGPDSFTYQMMDSRGVIGEFLVTVDVTEVNDAPTFETTFVNQTMAEDGTLEIDFTVSDVEDADSSLIVTATSGNTTLIPGSGLTVLNDNGDGTRTLRIEPSVDENGETQIYLTVTDLHATDPKSANAEFTVTVNSSNDISTPQDFTESTDENTTIYIDVIPTSDVDLLNEGDTVTITSVDSVDSDYGTTGIGIDPSDGETKVYFVPNSDWSSAVDATFTFDYAVQDAEMVTSVSATITMTKIAVNDAPVITVNETTIDINEDTTSTVYNFTVTDEETDDDTLVVTGVSADTDIITDAKIYIVNPPSGTATGEVRTYQIEPEADKNEHVNGVDVTLTVSDTELTDSHVLNVKIWPQNDEPGNNVVGDDEYFIDEDSGAHEFDVLANDDIDLTDPNPSESLTISAIITEPTNGTYTNNTTSITYTPNENFFGQDEIVYVAQDSEGQTGQFTVTINVANVNDAPVITADFSPIDTSEETDVLGTAFTVSDVDDVDASLTVTVVSSSNTRVAPLANIQINHLGDQDRSLDYYTNLLWNGTSTVVLRVTDDEGEYDANSEYTFEINVSSVNDPPEANPETVLVPEDHAGYTIDFIDEESDPDLATNPEEYVHYSSVSAPMCEGEVVGTVTITNGGDSLLFVPLADFNGVATFDYTLIDSGGEGDPLTDSDVCTVKIFPREDSPTTDGISETVTEDTPYVDLDVLSVSDDVDKDADLNQYPTFDLSAQTIDIDATPGAISGVDVGSAVIYDVGGSYQVIRYYPDANWNGVETFTYTIVDNTGNTVEGTAEVEVTPQPDSPVAVDDTLSMDEGDLTSVLDVLSNDTDEDLNALLNTHAIMLNNPEDLTISSFTQPMNDGTPIGSLAITDAGKTLTISGISENWNGILTFDYVVVDIYDNPSTGSVTLTVNDSNDNPVANADTVQITEDAAELISVLFNDTDVDTSIVYNNIPDIDPITGANKEVLSLVPGGLSTPSHGTVAIVGDQVRYTPTSDYNGSDSFTYTMQDADGVQRTALVTVEVMPEPDNPTAVDDTLSMDEDDLSSVLDVLSNDTDVDLTASLNTHEDMLNDPEDLTISSFTQPMNDGTPIGNLAITDAGKTLTISDIPANWNGILTFDYVVVDIYDNPSTGSVTLTVNDSNDNPVANADTVQITEDTAELISVLSNDTDVDTSIVYNNIPDIDPITGANKEVLSLVPGGLSTPSHGTVAIVGDQVRYTPTSDYNGSDSFTYTMQDADGVQRTALVTVEVMPEPDNPTAVDDTLSMDEDDLSSVLDVLSNDTDVDLTASLNTHEDMLNDPEDLTISSFTQPMNDGTPIGNLAISDAGKTLTISDIPANWNGILTFDYVVVDIYGNSSTGSVTLTVNYSNDAPIGNDDTASMTEDGSILIDVLYNDVDVDTFTTLNNIPEIDPVTGANKEELILLDAFIGVSDAVVSVESNQVRFTPSADWNGANVFTYTFRDHWGVERTAEVTVNVASAEDNPVVAPDNGTTEEDVAVVIDLFANDSDIDIDPALNNDASLPALSADIYEELDLVSTGFGAVTILDGPAFPTSGGTEDSGTIQITGDGIITYTPPQDWVGRVTFTYQAEDKDGNTAQSDVFILIGAVNDPPLPPTFVTPIQDSYYKDGQTVAVAWLEGSDADNDPLTYVVDFYDGTSWTNGVASFTPGLTLAHALGLTGVNTDVARYRARTYDGFAYSDYAYSDTFIIDNEAPVSVSPALQLADGSSYIPGTWVNENVYASESGGSDRLSVEYWMGINYGPLSEYAENGILALTTTGEYTVNFGTQDVLQNYRVVANQIVRIDKLNPIAPTVVFDHTDRRRGNVTVTFDNYSTDPGGSGNKWIITPKGEKLLITGGAESPSYDIRRNNDYTFGIMDAAGNRTDFIVTVDWIIPPPPVETSASPSDDDDDDDGDTSDYDDDDGDGDKDTGGPEPTPLNQEDDEQDGDVIGQTQDDKKSGGKDVLLKTRKAGAVGAVAGSSMGLLGLLVLWFFVLTNFTVKLAMVIDGKIVKRSKRRWILFAPKGSKTLGVNFIIKKPHQMKIAGTVVKKGLAKKMRAGKIVVTINGKPLKTFNVPKDIDTKYEKTVRI